MPFFQRISVPYHLLAIILVKNVLKITIGAQAQIHAHSSSTQLA